MHGKKAFRTWQPALRHGDSSVRDRAHFLPALDLLFLPVSSSNAPIVMEDPQWQEGLCSRCWCSC